jgi:hypothetical protein
MRNQVIRNLTRPDFRLQDLLGNRERITLPQEYQ